MGRKRNDPRLYRPITERQIEYINKLVLKHPPDNDLYIDIIEGFTNGIPDINYLTLEEANNLIKWLRHEPQRNIRFKRVGEIPECDNIPSVGQMREIRRRFCELDMELAAIDKTISKFSDTGFKGLTRQTAHELYKNLLGRHQERNRIS